MSSKPNPNLKELITLIHKFPKKKVLVLGDLIWDKYIYGTCSRISPEAPVPILLTNKMEVKPGGAANVLTNLIQLGSSAGIIASIGNDSNGHELKKQLSTMPLSIMELWDNSIMPTTTKTRFLANNQQLLRVDDEQLQDIPKVIEKKIIASLEKTLPNFDAIILSDYNKGLLTSNIISTVLHIAKKHNVFVAVDPKKNNFKTFKDATLITPNEKEAYEGMGLTPKELSITELGTLIQNTLNIQYVIITRSEKGMAVFKKEHQPIYIPTYAKEVFDVTGAGDTVIASLTLALIAGASHYQASFLGNITAGIVITQLGVASVSLQELDYYLTNSIKDS